MASRTHGGAARRHHVLQRYADQQACRATREEDDCDTSDGEVSDGGGQHDDAYSFNSFCVPDDASEGDEEATGSEEGSEAGGARRRHKKRRVSVSPPPLFANDSGDVDDVVGEYLQGLRARQAKTKHAEARAFVAGAMGGGMAALEAWPTTVTLPPSPGVVRPPATPLPPPPPQVAPAVTTPVLQVPTRPKVSLTPAGSSSTPPTTATAAVPPPAAPKVPPAPSTAGSEKRSTLFAAWGMQSPPKPTSSNTQRPQAVAATDPGSSTTKRARPNNTHKAVGAAARAAVATSRPFEGDDGDYDHGGSSSSNRRAPGGVAMAAEAAALRRLPRPHRATDPLPHYSIRLFNPKLLLNFLQGIADFADRFRFFVAALPDAPDGTRGFRGLIVEVSGAHIQGLGSAVATLKFDACILVPGYRADGSEFGDDDFMLQSFTVPARGFVLDLSQALLKEQPMELAFLHGVHRVLMRSVTEARDVRVEIPSLLLEDDGAEPAFTTLDASARCHVMCKMQTAAFTGILKKSIAADFPYVRMHVSQNTTAPEAAPDGSLILTRLEFAYASGSDVTNDYAGDPPLRTSEFWFAAVKVVKPNGSVEFLTQVPPTNQDELLDGADWVVAARAAAAGGGAEVEPPAVPTLYQRSVAWYPNEVCDKFFKKVAADYIKLYFDCTSGTVTVEATVAAPYTTITVVQPPKAMTD